jgi:hypothetical protein
MHVSKYKNTTTSTADWIFSVTEYLSETQQKSTNIIKGHSFILHSFIIVLQVVQIMYSITQTCKNSLSTVTVCMMINNHWYSGVSQVLNNITTLLVREETG